MKKIYYLFIAFTAIIFIFSCDNNISPDSYNKQEPTYDTTIPDNDQVSNKINKIIYKIGTISIGKEAHLVDNIIARYALAKELNDSDTPTSGDAVVFDANNLNSIISNKITIEKLKKILKSEVIFYMNGGTEKEFAQICDALSCYNPYARSTFKSHKGEVPVWIFSGKLPSSNGMYCRLSPSDANAQIGDSENSEVGFISDYVQGSYCDLIIGEIKEGLESNIRFGDSSNELTKIMSAIKIYIPGSQSINVYIKEKDKFEKRTNNYLMEYDIWNVFSENEKRNYYYIHQQLTLPFSNLFVGEYHDQEWAAFKAYGWCGTEVRTYFKHATNPNNVIFHKMSPNSTQRAKTYTSEVGFNIGGLVTTAEAGISGGVSINNSTSYTVEDITITNSSIASSSESQAAWQFNLREPDAHFHAFWFANVAIDEGSLNGRSTFISVADYVFSAPQGIENRWEAAYSVTMRLSRFYHFMNISTKHKEIVGTFKNDNIVLPCVK